jgi:AcrR family transcriptional regulator
MAERALSPSVVRTRPRDRKQQIITAASELFHRHGYANVSTGQIAESVGITAGALYRHFKGKQDLLAQALTDVFERATEVVGEGDPPSLEEMVEGLSATAGVRRDLGVLWNRETRHLDDARRAHMRSRFFAFLDRFATQLRAVRPELSADDADLLAWCVLGVLTSPSYHSTPMAEGAMIELLRRTALVVVTIDLDTVRPGDPAAVRPRASGLLPRARREAILAAATKLFHERGYQAVTMNEIGAAAGITSTAVYKYFESKPDLLSATIARASEPLQLGLSRALAAASTPAEGLHNALDAYVDFAMVHHDLVGILVSEVTNLPTLQRHGVRRAQHDYVAEWVRLLTDSRPDLDAAQARYLVQAALTVVNDATRTEHLLARPALSEELRLIGRRLLAVEL